MDELRKKLRKLPKNDFQKAIDYYEEYFADAGEENEAQAIEDLGTPQEAADSIIRSFAIENVKEESGKKDVRKGARQAWIAILAIFASPIALPIILTVVVLLFVLVLLVVVLLFTLGVVGVAAELSAIVSFAGAITMLFHNLPTAIACIGLAIALLSLGTLLIYGAYYGIRKFFYWIAITFGKKVEREERKNEKK